MTATVAVTDPGAETHSISVAWGDGSTSGPAAPAPVGHAYAAAGGYTVAVTVTDDDGGVIVAP